MATELPRAGEWRWPTAPLVGLGAGAGGSQSSAAIACATSSSASRLWPLERVAVRERRRHSAGSRRAARRHPRVDPHSAPGAKALHLAADERGIAPLPAIGQDHHHRAAGHPRRPWRSLKAFSASPMRVPLDQSGQPRRPLDRALRAARAQRSGRAREPRGERERLGVRPAAGRRGPELQVRARVGSIEPEMSHSITMRRRATRRRRRARRIGSPPRCACFRAGASHVHASPRR